MPFDMKTMMTHVSDGNPKFSKMTSSLRGLLNALDSKVISADKVQKELDDISIDSAKEYKKALKYTVDEIAGTCYTAVDTIKATMDRKKAVFHGSANGVGTYTSPKFEIKAKLYCIAPKTGGFEIGFIQDCTSKICIADYDDKSATKLVPSFRFPIGDSSNDSDSPFYYRGVSFECTKPCVQALADEAGVEYELEMNDYFIKNGFYQLAGDGNGNLVPDTKPISFMRKQGFSCWLARLKNDDDSERLLRQYDYVIHIGITWNKAGLAILDTSDSKIDGPTKNRASDSRPKVNAKVMNGAEFWRTRAKGSKVFN